MLFKRKNKEKPEHSGVVVADNPTAVVSEQYRNIRTNIQYSMVDKELQTLMVTSATPSSGKTTTAVNLAAAFASEGTRVLVVSSDMRKPRLHKLLDETNNVGLTNMLTNRELILKDVVKETYIDNLFHLKCGPIPPNPAELINSQRMDEIIEAAKNKFDLVIFDSPPVLAVTDAQILSTKVDGTIVVVPQGQVTKKELNDTAERLENVNANVLGVVMNMVEADSENYYYYYGDSE